MLWQAGEQCWFKVNLCVFGKVRHNYSHTYCKGFFSPRSIKRTLVADAVCRRRIGHDSTRLRSYRPIATPPNSIASIARG